MMTETLTRFAEMFPVGARVIFIDANNRVGRGVVATRPDLLGDDATVWYHSEDNTVRVNVRVSPGRTISLNVIGVALDTL